MTGTRDVRPVDFRKPRHAVPSVPRPVAQWHDRIGTLAGECWGKYLANAVTWSAAPCEVCSFAEVIAELPDPGFGMTLALGEPAATTLWVFEQSHLLALVADMLGMTEEAPEEPRPLTIIEESMAQLLVAELAWAIGEAWPGRESIPCRVGELERRPARSRVFAPGDTAFVSRFRLTGPNGTSECIWLVPQDAITRLVTDEWPDGDAATPVTVVTGHLEQLAGTLAMTLNIRLGGAQLPMSQLADLQVGDVIVLDQPINRPIVGEVCGEAKFLGFPGRIGPRQSFQVHEVLDA